MANPLTALDELILNENIDIAGKRVLLALKNELASKDVELAIKEKEIARLTNRYVDLAIKSMEGELADMKTKLANNREIKSNMDTEIAKKNIELANMEKDDALDEIRREMEYCQLTLRELQPRDIIGASSVVSRYVLSAKLSFPDSSFLFAWFCFLRAGGEESHEKHPTRAGPRSEVDFVFAEPRRRKTLTGHQSLVERHRRPHSCSAYCGHLQQVHV